MFHIFIYYILGYNVSRETLSCVIFYSIHKMFHVKHFMDDYLYIVMMSGSKGLSPHELAHTWVKDLMTRPDMSIKVG